MSEQVEIYTDGACKGNPGPGGWGALMIFKGGQLAATKVGALSKAQLTAFVDANL